MNSHVSQKSIQQSIKDQDAICINCRYYVHAIGVGFGIRCNHQTNQCLNGFPSLIPSRYHSCEHFKLK